MIEITPLETGKTLDAYMRFRAAGKANSWWVVAIDLDTGDSSFICPYCATGVEHHGTLH